MKYQLESTTTVTNIVMAILRFTRIKIVLPICNKLFYLVYGFDIIMAYSQLERLNYDYNKLAQKLDIIIDNPDGLWLYKNRHERMDASIPLFDERRRSFHIARYKFALNYAKNMNIADIASGTGYGAEILLKEGGAKTVIGVDINQDTVEYANRIHSGCGVNFICKSADKSDLSDGSVDVVVSFETIEHVTDDLKLLSEFHRILKPRGKLICSTPNNWPFEAAPFHVRIYDRQLFENTLSKFFTVEAMYNQNSGCNTPLNHGQAEGITLTTEENERNAECFIAVCSKQ